jgi:ABC-type branched-subunit amino acid transport system substrate-binding protein
VRRLRGRGVAAALCAAVALLGASCGPRYERTDATTAGNATELLPATEGTELGGTAPSGPTANRPAAGAPTGSSGSPSQTATGGPPAVAPKPGSIAGQTYRGVTTQAVTVGVMASQTVNAAYEALGASGASFPDPVKQIEPIVKWINEHGGVAGRKLQLAWHFRDDLSQDTDDTKMQQACTDFTQDKKVFLVTSIYQAHGMAPCLRDNDITLIESGAGPAQYGTPTFDSLDGYYVTPNQISVRRYAVALVQGLAKRGFFAGGAKVGLVYMGFPYAQTAVKSGLKPELKRLGVTLVDEQELRPIERASDFAGTQAEVSNAVLRFKQKGINRIISLEDQATTIMTAAEQQDYFPRYGLGSLSLFGAADSNPDSMKDSTLVGFNVQMDVLPRYRGASPAPEKTCRKIYLESRQAPDDELAWGLMEWHCEGFFFIKAALDGMQEVSSKGLVASIESLGTSYPSFTTYGMRLAANRYDGVAMARPLKFVPDCTCIRYAGSAYTIP